MERGARWREEARGRETKKERGREFVFNF